MFTARENPKRLRLSIGGIVQGVGFRPFVFSLASKFSLTGFVGNDGGGVFVEIEGTSSNIDLFLESIRSDPPPLALVSEMILKEIEPRGDKEFAIRPSRMGVPDTAMVSPDVSVCDDCLLEFSDPANRRYKYPFINCTNCGPRFTITRQIPYDRPNTTMSGFEMCALCRAEYEDPSDRRFHAQPISCPDCGPSLWFVRTIDSMEPGKYEIREDPKASFAKVQHDLRQGRIVAIKGIGGFHLACDAANDEAVSTLRERKGRLDKPFAVMCADIEVIREISRPLPEDELLLQRPERPIVLVPKRESSAISEGIAPGNNLIGVMLPYSPIHLLLFDEKVRSLVLTSGNLSDEPIAYTNREAMNRLRPLADSFLFHDRNIHIQCDDSVVRTVSDSDGKRRLLPIRRSRGYSPFPVRLPFQAPGILAVGGELKSTFCISKGENAILSQHIGDMENLETVRSFERSFEHMSGLFGVEPKFIACDKHPEYLSSKWARKRADETGTRLVEVQHHHAHLASAMAENGLENETVLGFCFDGTGFGDDGAIWGGEVLLGSYDSFERAAHLEYFPLVGGDSAVRKPYRVALGLLHQAGLDWNDDLRVVSETNEKELLIIAKMIERGVNAVRTSSFGRLFDGVAVLAGGKKEATYEAQTAIEFETLIDRAENGAYKFEFDADKRVILWRDLLADVVADLRSGVGIGVISSRFHNAVANLIVETAATIAGEAEIRNVVLSGGCFQNAALLAKTVEGLRSSGFTPVTHSKVPPNDGGIALGQLAVAAYSEIAK
ncbi:MAG: carbamoyltransferase HypF [Pyrinomonadaceae bacterium]